MSGKTRNDSRLRLRLRELRLRSALSQEDLARLSGLSQVSISRLETGITMPRPSTLRKLAIALDVPPTELWVSAHSANRGVE